MYAENLKRPIFDSGLKAERDYWIEKLSGAAPAAAAPRADFERPARDAGRREVFALEVPEGARAQLSKITKDSPVLVYTALLAALAVCLRRHAGANVVAVGSPARAAGGEGQAPNALALVCEVDDRESFKSLLLRTREAVLEAYARQSYPFGDIVSDLGLDGAGRGGSLFKVALSLEGFNTEMPATGHRLAFNFAAGHERLSGELAFDPEVYARETVERFAGHYMRLLGGALASVEARVGELEMLTEAERQQVVGEWNQTAAEFPRGRCLHQLFEEQAGRAPDAVAVSFGDEHLTYSALERKAGRLARRLRRLGVGPETTVGVMCGRSTELTVALLGVLKAGGAYMPLDPGYPPDRLAFMIEDSGAGVVVAARGQAAFVPPGANVRVVEVDEEGKREDAESPAGGAKKPARPNERNAAYVIYTSGSTGRPKGVCVEHRSVCNLVAAQIRAFRITPESRVYQFASLSFDASVSEVFTALAAGATLEMGRPDADHAGRELARELRERGVSVVTLPPAVLATMPEDESDSLLTLVSAGEACTAEVVRRWSPGRLFINAYGPTEATVCASLKVCGGEVLGAPTVGRPMSNTRAYVLDASLRPLPAGVAGELCVGGVGVARGYVGRPGLTAERFVPDPFVESAGERLYRTGDLALLLADGEIEFLGRMDRQVKVRGFRIETGEVEAALASHASVAAAVVVAQGESVEQRRLVAYFVPAEGGVEVPSASELRAFVQGRLPEYMTPAVFVELEQLPLTPNGKVDLRALPSPDIQRPSPGREFVGPRTPAEQLIAGIWAEVLGAERVGVEDNFFDLGGHSLLATQLVSRVRDLLRVEVPVNVVFESPTVAEFTERLAKYDGGNFDEGAAASLLSEIEGMSDAEAEALVADERRSLEAGERVAE